MKFISEHPDEAIAIAVKHTGMDEKTVREAFSHVAYTAVPAVEQEKEYVNFLNGPMILGHAEESVEQEKEYVNFLNAFKLINVPDETAFTGQFIKSLVK